MVWNTFFLFLFIIRISVFEKCLFRFIAHVLIRLLVFFAIEYLEFLINVTSLMCRFGQCVSPIL